MHINQFTVDKRLIGMYFKYPWGSLGFFGVPWGSLGLKDVPIFVYTCRTIEIGLYKLCFNTIVN